MDTGFVSMGRFRGASGPLLVVQPGQPHGSPGSCIDVLPSQQGRVTGLVVSLYMNCAAFGSDLVMATQLIVLNRGTLGSAFIRACNTYHLGELFYKHFFRSWVLLFRVVILGPFVKARIWQRKHIAF